MAGNRFRGARLRAVRNAFAGAWHLARFAWLGLRPLLRTAVVLAGIAGLGLAGWHAVLRSPYFLIRTLDIEPTAHLDREAILELTGLGVPVNIFRFDPDAVRDVLAAHPRVANARVEKILPDAVLIRLEERTASGVVVLEVPYLVDATGQPFARAESSDGATLPLVTGLAREDFEIDAEGARAHVREALAIARRYARNPLAAQHTLSDVHVAPGDRYELMLDRTRVALGREDHERKLARLERIFAQMDARKVDAEYILLGEDDERAIVKETQRAQGLEGLLEAQAAGMVN
ncbi:MAG: FtsQ-type POTRA domain-containing protein [Myxococcales bacterium]|nr:FtsQ-type POTRA domain-containing protein [Myxococcales bacterium]